MSLAPVWCLMVASSAGDQYINAWHQRLAVEQNVSAGVGCRSKGYALQVGRIVLEGISSSSRPVKWSRRIYLGK
jgi:hypothetical protein